MKLKISTTLLALYFCVDAFAGKFTVSSIVNGPGQYNDINTAIGVASAGDTIYVSPPYNNTDVTITKSITLIAEGNHADMQYPQQTSVSNFNFNIGINNVSINGFNVSSNIILGKLNYNINISSCVVGNFIKLNDSISNIVISNNIFLAQNIRNIDAANGCSLYNGASSIILQNNIFNGWIYGLNANPSFIKNNIFLSSGNAFMGSFTQGCAPAGSFIVSNAFIENNIFYRANPTNEVSGCVYQNNISYCPNCAAFNAMPGPGNLDNTDPLFVNLPGCCGAYFDWNHNYALQPTSLGINAGTDGLNIGHEGGNFTGSLRGETLEIPVIRKMNVQNFNVSQTGNVDVKVRSTKSREH